jgi:hypothetical protein
MIKKNESDPTDALRGFLNFFFNLMAIFHYLIENIYFFEN